MPVAAGMGDAGGCSLMAKHANGMGRRKNVWFRRGWEIPQQQLLLLKHGELGWELLHQEHVPDDADTSMDFLETS